MNHLLYEYSLCTALALMLFFGFYFILAQTPDKSIFNNYLRSRRTMGAALLVLSANYAVHLFCGIRFTNHNAAILMNLSTYFLCYWLFSSALTSLLDRFYITRRRLIQHITLWCLFTILSGCVLFYLPCGIIQNSALLCMATWLFAYGIRLARRLILAYRHAVRFFDDTIPTISARTYAGFPSLHTGRSFSVSVADCLHSCQTGIFSYGFFRPFLSIYTCIIHI